MGRCCKRARPLVPSRPQRIIADGTGDDIDTKRRSFHTNRAFGDCLSCCNDVNARAKRASLGNVTPPQRYGHGSQPPPAVRGGKKSWAPMRRRRKYVNDVAAAAAAERPWAAARTVAGGGRRRWLMVGARQKNKKSKPTTTTKTLFARAANDDDPRHGVTRARPTPPFSVRTLSEFYIFKLYILWYYYNIIRLKIICVRARAASRRLFFFCFLFFWHPRCAMFTEQ